MILFDCIIGNSSSGINEAPLLKKNVINLGIRQKGRYRFGSVIDVKNDLKSISNAIYKISKIPEDNPFDIEEFKKSHVSKSPSKQIIKFLKNIV